MLPRSGRKCSEQQKDVCCPHLLQLCDRRFTMIEDNKENKGHSSERGRVTLIFSLKNEVGELIKALKIFQENHVNLLHIESRKSNRRNSEFEILVDCDINREQLNDVFPLLKSHITMLSVDSPDQLTVKEDDNVYRRRRKYFAELAMNYKHGDPIPKIEFTEEEIKTWGTIFRELNKLYPTHACREYLRNLPLLSKYCDYREDNIPQLEDVSNFLKECTGFSIRPVAGYLSPRDFLSGLAFRVFHCTQYVRHSSDPLYTPEPSGCKHDADILLQCYFFTVEFGLCKQDGQLRVFGAGLLSSISELKHAISGHAKVKPFDPKVACKQECLITTFQDVYFVSESFEDAKQKMSIGMDFGSPFHIEGDSLSLDTRGEGLGPIPKDMTDSEDSPMGICSGEQKGSGIDTGELYVWGRNKHGQLASLAAFLLLPQRIDARCFQDEKVTAVWSGWTHLVAQTETGKVFTWGRADYGQLGRRLESPEGQKPHKQDSQLTFWRPQSSVSLPLCCLTGAAKESEGVLAHKKLMA
ncbi:tryptophan hydroxylase 1 [Cricetulus griseus]